MNIVVAGLGIIGGSMAKAIKKYTDNRVLGINRSKKPLEQALGCGAIDEIADTSALSDCDMLIMGMYPDAAVEFVRANADRINKNCIVIDTSGIKSEICPKMTELAREHGFTFVGFHPMAGKEVNGFESSEADLFLGANAIILPCEADDSAVATVAALASKIGFGTVVYTTPEEHDRMIAFTSQLPHVIACGYVFSPCCRKHKGFSGGSYRDVSRVANINAELWSELFINNSKPLVNEIDTFISSLEKIRNSIEKGDRAELTQLLQDARNVKEELGE